MHIYFEEKSGIFHLQNAFYSYIMKILPNGQMGQLYFGVPVRHRAGDSFDYLLERVCRTFSPEVFETDSSFFSLEQVRQEFPSAGTGDYRRPAVTVLQKNGSRISDFVYTGYRITAGKPLLQGLPATYCESDEEAQSLHLTVTDALTGISAELLYTVFEEYPVLARSVRLLNQGMESVMLDTAMSLSLDLPDADYELLQLSGAWCRERFVHESRLRPGVQSIGSLRGTSSHQHNPFICLRRPDTGERRGEALGFSLIYSGNFLAQAEVDNWGVTRVSMGIHPEGFSWKLEPGASFQTPEAVMVYTRDGGLNAMSQAFHALYGRRLARGIWRDRPRPILINNWEATTWNFTEDDLLRIAGRAAEVGIELFVLDDGWFPNRHSDRAGLGDWTACPDKLPDGIRGLSARIRALGLSFGLWFEPEMVNLDSDLCRAHPDWVLHVPGRRMTHGRHEYVLDYGRREIVDYIYEKMAAILREGNIAYVKWDMNRSITEAFSAVLPPDRQGEVFHRYILGVYDLYDRLTKAFPEILFESCASGGGRFDPGLLYYAPQGWASDCSDAAQRIRIQYGTSLCYPLSCIGAHVSRTPNMQLNRTTPLYTRANVAFFGTFGYEMDLDTLSAEELDQVRDQIAFMKKYRALFQFGTFYRLLSPFAGMGGGSTWGTNTGSIAGAGDGNHAAWMVVSRDRRTAIVGWYRFLNEVNGAFHRIRLDGLDRDLDYRITQYAGKEKKAAVIRGGDELMHIGLVTTDASAGECQPDQTPGCDFDSCLYVLESL